MELWSLFSAAIAMLLTQLLKDQEWPNAAKVVLAIIVCVGLGALQWSIGHPWRSITWEVLAENGAVIFATATAFYKLYFQETGVAQTLGEKKIL